MSDPSRPVRRTRGWRGAEAGPPPGHWMQGGGPPLPQPPYAWGPPGILLPVRAGNPTPCAQAGTASHRASLSTHDLEMNPGNVNVQQRLHDLVLEDPPHLAAGGDAGSFGRDSRRGVGQVLPDRVPTQRSRPATLERKKGTSEMVVNCFVVERTPQWMLYQYHVEITPEEDSTSVRKELLRLHKSVLGRYLFDGVLLYTVQKLHPDPIELYSDRADGERMKIVIKLGGPVSPRDYQYIDAFEMIMRKCFHQFGLELIGKDYFDPVTKYKVPSYNLEVWPGYKKVASMYKDNLLMATEIIHMLLRLDTVLQMVNEYAAKGEGYQDAFQQFIIGQIVLTDYNNRTHRIDDVAWNETPQSTFRMKDENVSYIDYYQKKYNIRIKDVRQPLLMSRTKGRGRPGLVRLVPELCRHAGLSYDIEADGSLMRHIAVVTDMAPDETIVTLQGFHSRFTGNKKVVDELAKWSLKLAPSFVPGQIPPNYIVQPNDPIRILPPRRHCEMTYISKELLPGPNTLRPGSDLVIMNPVDQRHDAENFVSDAGYPMPRPEIVPTQCNSRMNFATMCKNFIAAHNPALILGMLARKFLDDYL